MNNQRRSRSCANTLFFSQNLCWNRIYWWNICANYAIGVYFDFVVLVFIIIVDFQLIARWNTLLFYSAGQVLNHSLWRSDLLVFSLPDFVAALNMIETMPRKYDPNCGKKPLQNACHNKIKCDEEVFWTEMVKKHQRGNGIYDMKMDFQF